MSRRARRATMIATYRVMATGLHALLEDAEIEYEIYSKMKKYMHESGLKKTIGHKAKEDIQTFFL